MEEDHEEEFRPMGFFAIPTPPQDVQDMMHRHSMAHQALTMRIDEMFDRLSGKDAALLALLFQQCGLDSDAAHYFRGLLVGVMKFKLDVCIQCGEPEIDHLEGGHDGKAPAPDADD